MALKEFKDLPNTDTPINAENLNYNFNELKTKFWVGIADVTSLKSTEEFETNPNSLIAPIYQATTNTEQITVNNGIITVGEKIKAVKVSYNVRYDWNTPQGFIYYQLLNGNGGDLWVTQSAHEARGHQAIPNFAGYVIDTSVYKTIHMKMYANQQTNNVVATAYIYIEVLEEG